MGGYSSEAAPVPQLMNLSVPPGTLIEFAGTVAPYGYLVCPVAQTNLSRTLYPDLFAAIGTTWGAGDGSSTFGMPWFPAGYAATQANGDVSASTLGTMPAHSHVQNFDGLNIFGDANTSTGNALPTPTNAGTVAHQPMSTAAAGSGSTNFAAGVRVLRCVKY